MSGAVSAIGGAYSIAAESEDLLLLADQLRRASSALADAAAVSAKTAADPRAAPGAVLDPVGAIEVAGRAALTCAVAADTAVGLAALAANLAAAASGYRAADSLRADYLPSARGLLAAPRAMADLLAAPVDLVSGHDDRVQRIVTDDPYLADWALGVVAGVGRPVVGPDTSIVGSASGLLGSLYRDGTPTLMPISNAPVDDSAGAPRSVTDLIRGLVVRDAAEEGGQSGGGMIDIRFVQHSQDGSRSVIVDLPGTTRWNFNPLTATPQVSDFGADLRALGSRSTAYERGVVAALTAAGVRPDEPIMLVGHSEGGLVAAQLASDLSRGKQFSVTHVVTAGAPLGVADLPPTVSTLALENRHDVVVQLDGRDNPGSRNHVTATFDRGAEDVGSKHAATTYLQGAADVDASDDPSLAAWKNQANGFFDGTSVQTQVFQIRRG